MKSLIIAFIILFGIAATAVYYPIQTDSSLTGDGTYENPLAVSSGFSSRANPSGGSTGDVLTKDSGTDYDYSWTAPSGGGVAYDEYVAILSQSGTSDPTAVVLETLAAGTIVITRVDVGNYLLTLTGAFTSNKTYVQVSQGMATEDLESPVFVSAARQDANVVNLRTYSYGGSSQDISDITQDKIHISIRVYP